MHVSVIISTYNRPDYLKRVLEGHLCQSCLPDEIIVADDGSDQNTALVVQDMQKCSAIPLRHVWQEHKGFRVGQIRNKAIARSSGEYLIISDGDSIPAPTFVNDHVQQAEEGYFIQGHRVLLGPRVSETFAFSDVSLRKVLGLWLQGQAHNVLNALRLQRALAQKSRKLKGIRTSNMSFFRRDFVAVNGFSEEFEGWGKEDTELVMRFYCYGLRRKDIRFQASCYHLHHPLYSRDNLARNIALLEKTAKENSYLCRNGISKYLTADLGSASQEGT